MNHSIDIHLEWSGPLSYEDACKVNGDSDWGVYQIYGSHPCYGADVLLYIGKAERQHFGERLKQKHSIPYNYDINSTKVYFGRLAGEDRPDDETWNRHIVLAEKLLIYAHRPAWNSTMNMGKLDSELQNVHVFNWMNHKMLLPEVSGSRWSSRLDSMTRYHVFKADEPRIPASLATGQPS